MKKFSSKKIILCSILLVLFIVVAIMVLTNKILGMDEAIYQFIMSGRCSFLDRYFIFITHFGDTLSIVLFVTLFLLFTRNKDGLLLTASAVSSALVCVLTKHLFVRTRPNHLKLIEQGGYSFPSGHAMISICVYGFLLYLVFLKVKNKYIKYTLIAILTILIISIGISRIYVGVHYPSDVIGGYLLGGILITLITEIIRLERTSVSTNTSIRTSGGK